MPSALRNKLDNDPENLGYAPMIAAFDISNLEIILNDKTFSRNGYIPLGTFSVWMTANGIRRKLREGAANSQLPVSAQDLCQDVLDIEKNPHMTVLDMSDATTLALVDTLVQIGVITSQEKDSLVLLSQTPQSRYEALFGVGKRVTQRDIINALAETV